MGEAEPSEPDIRGISSTSISDQMPLQNVAYVSVPHISEAEKALYQSPFPTLDERVKVDELVGEAYDDVKGPLYYGRYMSGIINGFPAEGFAQKYPELIEAYEAKKKEGTLAPFNPSGKEVHPNWQIKFRLTIDQRQRRASVSASSAHGSLHGDDDSDQSQELDSEDEIVSSDLHSDDEPTLRRSSRHKTKTSTLPFSPRKTRSAAVYVLDSDDEGSDAPVPRRRSQRVKPTKIPLHEDESSQLGESDVDEYVARKSRGKRLNRQDKGRKQGRSSGKAYKRTTPEYGVFRSTDELDEDPDPETRQLRAHWKRCGKCHTFPAHKLVANEKKKKGKRRKRTSDDELEGIEDEMERLQALGGWVRCLKCAVSLHWSCLPRRDQEEIIRAARDRDRAEWLKAHEGEEDLDAEKDGPRKRPGLSYDQMTEFICNHCTKDGMCIGCLDLIPAQSVQAEDRLLEEHFKDADGDIEMKAASATPHSDSAAAPEQLLFRCFTCKRLAHYQHIEDDIDPDRDLAEVASHYQTNWLCGDCASYQWSLDKILAWRPYPATAAQPPHPVNIKEPLPREYLVKWQERGYRRIEWVPHMWLVSTHLSKLKNFIANGTNAELLGEVPDHKAPEEEPIGLFNVSNESPVKQLKVDDDNLPSSLSPLVDAEDRIPLAWKTVDRVLDVQLRFIPRTKPAKKKKPRRSMMAQSEEEQSEAEEAKEAFQAAFDRGEEPRGLLESVDDWEERTGIKFDPEEHIGLVIWAFFKWVDLGYEESTWDAPPQATDSTYPAFREALERFSAAREVQVPKLTKQQLEHYLSRSKRKAKHIQSADELDLGQDQKLRLMPFQVEGFNWLAKNWWNQQPCILADEMGLGKTVQITSFIGFIMQKYELARPALVVVPNSTITNWVREFERWAPNLRVVPFSGEAKSRDVVKKFELRHPKLVQGTTGAKFHVLVTTYESITNAKEFGTVFKGQPRWELLVVDEGQRLKSDSSLLFKKLNELNTGHRIIMTGTPLNNNIRELFNLMNFLDPDEWNDLPTLEREYADLNEDLIKDLHNRLRPYFLRRIKSEVLDLPPKNEVIVPVSMSSLQKQVYRSILSHNVELLQGLMQPTGPNPGTRKATINNMLMQLRKCLQHPYLYDEDIEPRGLRPEETHEKLISASAKLRLLKDLLPKLKARGHRVLIFSQFVIALNIIEDFLVGEGHKFLRLDGGTKGADRQKGMDEFNRPNSDVFIYLLTTRAGGVGINLFTADTVIIFDPDFNPHQDLQAIARAHRFGQKKTCLVFKLMVKDSAEERIMQIGKKKLVLDHLIVQKMDDDEAAGENVQSILTYGAQQLFDGTDENSKDIVYFESDIDNLIAKTEKEGDEESTHKEGAAFSFAKIWTADKDELEEITDDNQFEIDSWAQTLQKINEEMAKKQAQEDEELGRAGRRVRRKTATAVNYAFDLDSPRKNHRQRSSDIESAYHGSERISDSNDSSEGEVDALEGEALALVDNKKTKFKATTFVPPAISDTALRVCGLCGQTHGPNNCPMTESSENLVEYREMLIMHTEDETYEQRRLAVNSIDEVLRRRGHASMIVGRALYPVRSPRSAVLRMPAVPPVAQSKPGHTQATSMPVISGAGPSHSSAKAKRSISPSSSLSSSKKTKQQQNEACAVCGKIPLHKLKDCSIVKGDLATLFAAADRLGRSPGMAQVADTLRRHGLQRQKTQ